MHGRCDAPNSLGRDGSSRPMGASPCMQCATFTMYCMQVCMAPVLLPKEDAFAAPGPAAGVVAAAEAQLSSHLAMLGACAARLGALNVSGALVVPAWAGDDQGRVAR